MSIILIDQLLRGMEMVINPEKAASAEDLRELVAAKNRGVR
jgi:hypothetical protein